MPATDAPAVPPLAPARTVPFERLSGFPALFQRYAAGDPAALRFFAHDFRDPAALAEAAATAAAHERDRDALADVLAEQNAGWGNDAALPNVERLRHPEAVAVVTGQQLGLFGGPLYTVYKAVTALQLAARLEQEAGRPVIPVFWLAGEDHDYDEVRATAVLSGNEPVRIALPESDARTPVGRRTLGDAIAAAADEAEAALRPTEFTPELMAALRDAWQPGRAWRDAFARWMAWLFRGTGLVLCTSDDARLKRLAAPAFKQEVEGYAETHRRLEAVGEALGAAGFHQQVTPLPVNLFLLEPEGRFTLDPEPGGDGFTLRGLDRRFSRADLLDLLEQAPERFSPNVVLRPVVEGHLFPTVAYVAGPGEASYYAQLGPVYEAFGVPMPVVYPRASVTLVEGKVQKVLDRYGLTAADLDGDLEGLHRRLVLAEAEHDVEAAFGDAARQLHEAVNGLKPVAQAADPTLAKSAEATRAALQHELDALKQKVVRAEKRSHDQVRAQLEKAQAGLFPTGRPQERVLSPLYVLNKYGLDLVPRLVAGLPTDTTAHQIVEL